MPVTREERDRNIREFFRRDHRGCFQSGYVEGCERNYQVPDFYWCECELLRARCDACGKGWRQKGLPSPSDDKGSLLTPDEFAQKTQRFAPYFAQDEKRTTKQKEPGSSKKRSASNPATPGSRLFVTPDQSPADVPKMGEREKGDSGQETRRPSVPLDSGAHYGPVRREASKHSRIDIPPHLLPIGMKTDATDPAFGVFEELSDSDTPKADVVQTRPDDKSIPSTGLVVSDEISRLQNEVQRLSAERLSLWREVDLRTKELEMVRTQTEQDVQQYKEYQKDNFRLMTQLRKQKDEEFHTLHSKFEALSGDVASKDSEIDRLKKELYEYGEANVSLKNSVTELKNDYVEQTQNLQQAGCETDAVQRKYDKLKQKFEAYKQEVEEEKQQRESEQQRLARYREFAEGLREICQAESFIQLRTQELSVQDSPELRAKLASLELDLTRMHGKFGIMQEEILKYLCDAGVQGSTTVALKNVGIHENTRDFLNATYKACLHECRRIISIEENLSKERTVGSKDSDAQAQRGTTGATKHEPGEEPTVHDTHDQKDQKDDGTGNGGTHGSRTADRPQDGATGWADKDRGTQHVWGDRKDDGKSGFDTQRPQPSKYGDMPPGQNAGGWGSGNDLGAWDDNVGDKNEGYWFRHMAESARSGVKHYMDRDSKPRKRYDKESCELDYQAAKACFIRKAEGMSKIFRYDNLHIYDALRIDIGTYLSVGLAKEKLGDNIWRKILQGTAAARQTYVDNLHSPENRKDITPDCGFDDQEDYVMRKLDEHLLKFVSKDAYAKACDMCDKRNSNQDDVLRRPKFEDAFMWMRIWCTPATKAQRSDCKIEFCKRNKIVWSKDGKIDIVLAKWMQNISMLERVGALREDDDYEPFDRLLTDATRQLPETGRGTEYHMKMVHYANTRRMREDVTRADFLKHYDEIIEMYDAADDPLAVAAYLPGHGPNATQHVSTPRERSATRQNYGGYKSPRSGRSPSRPSYGGYKSPRDGRSPSRPRYDGYKSPRDERSSSRQKQSEYKSPRGEQTRGKDDRRGREEQRPRDSGNREPRRSASQDRRSQERREKEKWDERVRLRREFKRQYPGLASRDSSADSAASRHSGRSAKDRGRQSPRPSAGRSRSPGKRDEPGNAYIYIDGAQTGEIKYLDGRIDKGDNGGNGMTFNESIVSDDCFCVQYDGTYYQFNRRHFEAYIEPGDINVWKENEPGLPELCFAFRPKRRCMDPDCPCRDTGDDCRNVGKKLVCDVPDCKWPSGHNHHSCFKLHPGLKKGRFQAKGASKARPKSREPSVDRNGQRKANFGRKDF